MLQGGLQAAGSRKGKVAGRMGMIKNPGVAWVSLAKGWLGGRREVAGMKGERERMVGVVLKNKSNSSSF